ncbi:MAG: hypothetical protein NW237_14865 [Cyanobacteriota bacterium]|nr:hypothetical protein [Cyanobacteriota bacterium]
MIETPEPLRRSFEKFMLDATEPLDPLISLKLTQLVVLLGDTAYAMGFSDGQRQPYPACQECPQRVWADSQS